MVFDKACQMLVDRIAQAFHRASHKQRSAECGAPGEPTVPAGNVFGWPLGRWEEWPARLGGC